MISSALIKVVIKHKYFCIQALIWVYTLDQNGWASYSLNQDLVRVSY